MGEIVRAISRTSANATGRSGAAAPLGLRRVLLLAGVAGLLLALVLATFNRVNAPPPAPFPLVRFALPTQVSAGAISVAAHRQLFHQWRVDVRIEPFRLGKQALASVIEGKADLALVADTPFMLAALKGEKIAVVARAFGSRNSMAVLARADGGIGSAADLRGKSIATVAGTNAEFFIDALLTAHGMSTADVTVVPMSPEAMPAALTQGRVDAATLWLPDLATVRHQMGPRAVTIESKDLHVYQMLIVGKTDYLESHVDDVGRVLAALAESTEYIHAQPASARADIAAAIGVEQGLLQSTFMPSDFRLQLDQSLLFSLGEQARWAVRKKLVPPAAGRDYRHLLQTEPLQRVRPASVRLID